MALASNGSSSRQLTPSQQNAAEQGKRERLLTGSTAVANQNKSGSTGESSLAGVQNSMSEAHEKLMERGEKLNRLADKSAETAQAADEFAKMARQLNESQRRSWF